jgi:DNA-binding NarL/FixJ family response regulator
MSKNVKSVDAIELLLVDDHSLLRGLLIDALTAVDDFRVVGDAPDAEAGIKLCEQLQPNVLILDSVLPGLQGAASVEAILRVSPRTRILMFSGVISPASIQRALAGGARGYLPKSAIFPELVEGIRAIHSGRYFFGAGTHTLITGILAQGEKRTHGLMLSDRELSVLAGIAQGRSSKEIASQLELSVFTVENHRRRVMEKTGIHSVAQLTLLALELGLIAPVKPLDAPAEGAASG